MQLLNSQPGPVNPLQTGGRLRSKQALSVAGAHVLINVVVNRLKTDIFVHVVITFHNADTSHIMQQ